MKFLFRVLVATLMITSTAFAECSRFYVRDAQSKISKAEKAIERFDTKIQSLQNSKISSNSVMEQRINRVEDQRVRAYTSARNLRALLNTAGTLITCIFNPSRCAEEATRVLNEAARLEAVVLTFEQRLDQLRDDRNRKAGLWESRIATATANRAQKIAQVAQLNQAFDECKELVVVRPTTGSTIQGQVRVETRVVAATLAPLGDSRPSRAVLGIVIDGPAVAVGQTFPVNQSGFVLLDQGEKSTNLTLAPGPHTITVQVLTGIGVARADFAPVSRTFTVSAAQ